MHEDHLGVIVLILKAEKDKRKERLPALEKGVGGEEGSALDTETPKERKACCVHGISCCKPLPPFPGGKRKTTSPRAADGLGLEA